jgi:hypothetical protein
MGGPGGTVRAKVDPQCRQNLASSSMTSAQYGQFFMVASLMLGERMPGV